MQLCPTRKSVCPSQVLGRGLSSSHLQGPARLAGHGVRRLSTRRLALVQSSSRRSIVPLGISFWGRLGFPLRLQRTRFRATGQAEPPLFVRLNDAPVPQSPPAKNESAHRNP